MKKYIIVVRNRKNSRELVIRSEGSTELAAKEYARMFLNGNCEFVSIKCINRGSDES